jgi:Zn-dependent peptidase ImmA (M78 family)/transcriptional regulator with XRE-family HTH domain
MTLEDAAGKVPTKPERLGAWERGDDRPTLNQLRKLANAYKRPIALFYLPEPPGDFKPLQHDFRRLPGLVSTVKSPRLLYEIRHAYARREVALDLWSSAGKSPPAFTLTAALEDDAEGLGARLRTKLAPAVPTNWNSDYDPFNFWRSKLEAAGVLVFQAERIQVGEMRGFSISERRLPVIVLNIKDSPRGRTFTMLHELTHLMLHEAGVCDLQEESQRPEENKIEIFCNRVAGAALVPQSELLAESVVRSKARRDTWSNSELRSLSNRFGVSRRVILRRLLILGRTTQAFYKDKQAEFDETYARLQPEEGFAPPYRVALSTAGPLFARLVLTSYYQESITASDVSDFLGVRLKHLPKIEAELFSAR